jgi:Amt family ammonium transporter
MGGVSFWSQLIGSVMGAAYAVIAGFIIYTAVDILFGFRLAAEDERRGADLSIHKIGANPEEDVRMGRV